MRGTDTFRVIRRGRGWRRVRSQDSVLAADETEPLYTFQSVSTKSRIVEVREWHHKRVRRGGGIE